MTLPLELPVYAQGDPRWADVKLGYCSDLTLKTHGCLVTCFGMASQNTPPVINSMMQEKKLFLDCGIAATFDLRKITGDMTDPRLLYVSPPYRAVVAREFAEDAASLSRSAALPEGDVTRLISHLRSQKGPAIIEVNSGWPGRFSQHFVLGKSSYNYNVVISDPLTGTERLLAHDQRPKKDYWYGNTLATAVTRYILYEG